MTEPLLPYYHRELAFIRRLGAEFAEAHPKIAGRLQLGPDAAEDPHVERLIEAFAYLNARTRRKLEDDFPELADSMLDVIYPHYRRPVPSMAVVQFVTGGGGEQLSAGYAIPADASVETDPIDGEPVRFRTRTPVMLWPIEVESAELTGRPFTAPAARGGPAEAVLRLVLRCVGGQARFAALPLERLRWFLYGQSSYTYRLHELLLNEVTDVLLAESARDAQPISLGSECLAPVGFERDEGMLPYSPRSMAGYRLLTEFFCFPQKFLFVDLEGLTGERLARFDKQLEIYVFLKSFDVDLQQNLDAGMFQLGCTPVVNLFRKRAEPIALDHTQTEYRIVPDARRPLAHEVYSIDRVAATSPDGVQVEFEPFYSIRHREAARQAGRFWHATRRPAQRAGGEVDQASEVYMTLVDLGFSPNVPQGWTLEVDTTCLNRNLPRRLPTDQGAPNLRLSKGGPLKQVRLMTGRFTPTYRAATKPEAAWRLISHLSLNHLSLVDGEQGAEALREILALYNFADSGETRSMIHGIRSVRSRRVVGRTAGGFRGGICRGVEVTIDFDEDRFTGSSLFLFAMVLERFLGLYCTINSFSQLVATTNRREGELRRWRPRAGETVLL